MCHNEQWIGGYTVLLEAAQVVYSDDCISSKRCSYSKEHYSKCIDSVECSEVSRRKHFSYKKTTKVILNHKVILIRSFCPEKSTQRTDTT